VQKFCDKCEQRSRCQDVHKQLGSSKGPSVTLKVITAFLLPLLVFIVAIAAFETILNKLTINKRIQTAISFVLAFLTTFVFILVVRLLNRRAGKDDNRQHQL